MTRRDFIALTAGSAAAATVPPHESVRFKARPFDLRRVRLGVGIFRDCAQINRRYMMSLDIDSLLHMFRVTAGLASSAKPLGGWEQPANELRGHFAGHYLSGCALAHASM